MDILRVESYKMKNLLSKLGEKALKKTVGSKCTEFSVENIDIQQENDEVSFDIHISGKLGTDEIVALLSRFV